MLETPPASEDTALSISKDADTSVTSKDAALSISKEVASSTSKEADTSPISKNAALSISKDGNTSPTSKNATFSISKDATASKPLQSTAAASVPTAPHTILHFWLDATPEDLASARPGANPDIAMAIPSSLFPDLLQNITKSANSARVNTLTLNVPSVGTSQQSPSSHKRKLGEDAEISQASQRVRVEISQPPKRQKRKGVFSRMPLQGLETFHHAPNSLAATPPKSHGPDTTFTRENLYSKDGSIQLGLVASSRTETTGGDVETFQVISTSESETYGTETAGGDLERRHRDERMQPAEEASAVAQPPVENQPPAQTPRSSRWGFGDLLKSARSVSKFLPGFPRALSVPTPIIADGAIDPNSHLNPTPPAVDRPAINIEARSQSSAAQTLQLENPQPIAPPGHAENENSHGSITKRQAKSSKKGSHPKTGSRTDSRKAGRDKNLRANSLRSVESFAEAKHDSTPGTKRKRLGSPDIIPNPGGSSYGMDLDYFGFSSSGEEDEVLTPSKTRPSKQRRLRGPDNTMPVDTGRAQPYSGGSLSSGTANYQGGNFSSEGSALESSKLQARKSMSERSLMRTQQSPPPRTPIIITNLTGSFRVPSPSDSDSDLEEPVTESPPHDASTELTKKGQDFLHSTSTSPKKPAPRVDETSSQTNSFISNEKTSRTQSPPSKPITLPTKTTPTTWTQPPPPRPNPPHAALPSVSSVDSEALARARKKALHYQPHKPSGLRASSRISSPRISEDSKPAEAEGTANSTSQTDKSGDIDTALTTRSENVVVSKPGDSDTPKSNGTLEKMAENAVSDIATKDNATSITKFEPPLSSYVRDPKIEACLDAFWKDENTNHASDMFELLYADFLAKQ